MVKIQSLDDRMFLFDEISHYRKFFSDVRGDVVRIYNAYNPSDVLLDYTNFAEIELNGVTYGSAKTLQTELLDVLFVEYVGAGSGGGGGTSSQDNIFIPVNVNYTGIGTETALANAVNSSPSFIVSERQLIIGTGVNPSLPYNQPNKVVFVVSGIGKGTYGTGGIVLTASNIKILAVAPPNIYDIVPNPTTQIIDLGELGGLTVSEKVNQLDPPVIVQGQESGYVVFKSIFDGNEVYYLFLGDAGEYGLGAGQTTDDDFVLLSGGSSGGSVENQSLQDVVNVSPNLTENSYIFIGSSDGWGTYFKNVGVSSSYKVPSGLGGSDLTSDVHLEYENVVDSESGIEYLSGILSMNYTDNSEGKDNVVTEIFPNRGTKNTRFYMPKNNSGTSFFTIPISVDGNFADENGNILTSGGGGSQDLQSVIDNGGIATYDGGKVYIKIFNLDDLDALDYYAQNLSIDENFTKAYFNPQQIRLEQNHENRQGTNSIEIFEGLIKLRQTTLMGQGGATDLVFQEPLSFQNVTIQIPAKARRFEEDGVTEKPYILATTDDITGGGGSQTLQDTLENGSVATVRESISINYENETEYLNNSALYLGSEYVELRGQTPDASALIIIDNGKFQLTQNVVTEGGSTIVEFETPTAETKILIPAKPIKFEEDGVTPIPYVLATDLQSVFDNRTGSEVYASVPKEQGDSYFEMYIYENGFYDISSYGETTRTNFNMDASNLVLSLRDNTNGTDSRINVTLSGITDNNTKSDYYFKQKAVTGNYYVATEDQITMQNIIDNNGGGAISSDGNFEVRLITGTGVDREISFFATNPEQGTYIQMQENKLYLFQDSVNSGTTGGKTSEITIEEGVLSIKASKEGLYSTSLIFEDPVSNSIIKIPAPATSETQTLATENQIDLQNVVNKNQTAIKGDSTLTLFNGTGSGLNSVSSMNNGGTGVGKNESYVTQTTDSFLVSVFQEDANRQGKMRLDYDGISFEKRVGGNWIKMLFDEPVHSDGAEIKIPSLPTSRSYKISVAEVFENSTTTELSLSDLTTTYPNAQKGDVVNCLDISTGALQYEKTSSGWISKTVNVVS